MAPLPPAPAPAAEAAPAASLEFGAPTESPVETPPAGTDEPLARPAPDVWAQPMPVPSLAAAVPPLTEAPQAKKAKGKAQAKPAQGEGRRRTSPLAVGLLVLAALGACVAGVWFGGKALLGRLGPGKYLRPTATAESGQVLTIASARQVIGPEGGTLGRIAPGILWVGALLSCLLSLDRIFALDREDCSLDLLATAPIPLEGVVAVKAAAHWLTTGLPLTLAAPVLGVLLNLPEAAFGWLALSLMLGTPALSMIGTFGAALTVGLKRGGLLLSLLVLPLYIPTLIFGAEAAKRGAEGLAAGTPHLMLAGITAGSVAILPFAAAAAIRVNLR